MRKISLLIPAFNEEAVLPSLYKRILSTISNISIYQWEILFVNDGSNDNTII